MPVCGPLLLVDPTTHTVVANERDRQGLLNPHGDVYIGHLPDTVPIANYTTTWGGVRWAMIVWPFLTADRFQRVKLMEHESFHRIQNALFLAGVKANNDHLDSEVGRIWLQLEWRALRQALTTTGAMRRAAVQDALTFRWYRRSLFPQADTSEHAAEMSEGLAEYTGFKLSAKGSAELIDHLTKAMDAEAIRPTFVSTFAYISGPAYGALLDAADPRWRNGVNLRQDLGAMLQSALKIELSPDLKAAAEKQALLYGGEALQAAEAQRTLKRQDQIAAYRKRFLDAPTLLVPLSDHRTITVAANDMVPLEGIGAVYSASHIVDEWGELVVKKGALMIQNENGRILQAYLSLPDDPKGRPLKGDGWTLDLAPGWAIVPGSREGDFLIQKIKP